MVGVNPMLATAVTQLPTEPGWAFEFKWDGVRALIDVSDQGVIIRSRAGNDVTAAYPELVALASDVEDALLDGEIVAFDAGAPSFELLQSRMHVRSAVEARRLAVDAPVTFVAFELLRRYGIDLSSRPYAERRATLERWAAERPDWTISPVFDDGAATAAAAHEHGLKGSWPNGSTRRTAQGSAARTGASCGSCGPGISSSSAGRRRAARPRS
jgi:bifunctional non-homologous end joining protein LigD